MCGRKARYRLSGIPGVSQQDTIVNSRPGWCVECLVNTYFASKTVDIPLTALEVVYRMLQDACSVAMAEITEAGLV